ncbi:MAG: hypothetical protein PHE84_03945 [bacterium]|nr:hypothetical protein [bacterium]
MDLNNLNLRNTVIGGVVTLLLASSISILGKFILESILGIQKGSDIILSILIIFVFILITIFSVIFKKVRSFLEKIGNIIINFIRKYWRYLIIILLISLIEVIQLMIFPNINVVLLSLSYVLLLLLVILFFVPKREFQKYFNYYEDDFRFGLSYWKINNKNKNWKPQLDNNNGLIVIPHDDLSNVMVLKTIPNFMNGIIECVIYLSHNSTFNIIFRANLNENEFYMARVDSRLDHWDCILFKQKDSNWKECNKENLKYHSPHNQFVKMRVEINDKHISLYRDSQLVDSVTNAISKTGEIGFFSELTENYLRNIRVIKT